MWYCAVFMVYKIIISMCPHSPETLQIFVIQIWIMVKENFTLIGFIKSFWYLKMYFLKRVLEGLCNWYATTCFGMQIDTNLKFRIVDTKWEHLKIAQGEGGE